MTSNDNRWTRHEGAPETRETLAGHLAASLTATLFLIAICCGLYPALIWGIAQAVFPARADGSLVKKDGSSTTDPSIAVGSTRLAQGFAAPEYFHPRPSSAGAGYDAARSGGSNLGPLSDKLINGVVQKDDAGKETLAFDGIRLRTLRYALENGISFESSIPLEMFKNGEGKLDEVKIVNAFPHAGDPPDKEPLVLKRFSSPIPGDAVTASGSGLDPHISPANARLQRARVARARNMKEDDLQKVIEEHTEGPDLGILGEPGVNVLRLNISLDATRPVTP